MQTLFDWLMLYEYKNKFCGDICENNWNKSHSYDESKEWIRMVESICHQLREKQFRSLFFRQLTFHTFQNLQMFFSVMFAFTLEKRQEQFWPQLKASVDWRNWLVPPGQVPQLSSTRLWSLVYLQRGRGRRGWRGILCSSPGQTNTRQLLFGGHGFPEKNIDN